MLNNKKNYKSLIIKRLTRQIPWLTLIQINLSNGSSTKTIVKNLLREVVSYEFFICWMKPKTWWQFKFLIFLYVSRNVFHCFHPTLKFSVPLNKQVNTKQTHQFQFVILTTRQSFLKYLT